MSGVYDDAVATASELSGEARAAADEVLTRGSLSPYLPVEESRTLTFSVELNGLDLDEIAGFRAYDTGGTYGRAQGSRSTAQGKLPPITRRYKVDEVKLLLELSDPAAKKAEYIRLARRSAVAIANRLLLAQAEALVDASLTLDENGIVAGVDYGRDASHDVVAAKLFTDPTADVVGMFESWNATYRATQGTDVAVWLLSRKALQALTTNAWLLAYANVNPGVDRISPDTVRSILSEWGIFVRVYEEVIGTTRLIPEEIMLGLPASGSDQLGEGQLGKTMIGVTAEGLQPAYGLGGDSAVGLFSAAFGYNNPERTEVSGTAVGLPVLTNANATFKVEVL